MAGGGISGPVRMALFGAIVVAVVAAAAFVLVDRFQGPATLEQTAIQVRADMGGFDPGELTVSAGETVRIEFASLDTPYHNDGGGWHQFAIDDLGIDWQVGPQSSEVFSFQAPAQPGSYDFYCDICCGGKENPNMQGTLTVTA
ncbi:MAG: cupredoxin domain-containing protein [Chloroflexota bacterium]